MSSFNQLPAPAKLNLFLHIIGKQSNGYHLLQSVFMLINWCDWLSFERRPSGISREDTHNSACTLPIDDLCTRAAKALQQATGCKQGVHIALQKNIPAQAGMGGGSSDAATCLLALNRLWQLELTRAQLMEIALTLGADVPFFLHGSHAWVEGIGERLHPIALPSAQFIVIKPPIGTSTPAIFAHPTLKRDMKPAIIEDFAEMPYSFGCNALQTVAQSLNPQIGQALDILSAHGLQGRMTGSGSAVFAKVADSVSTAGLMRNLHADLPADWVVKLCANMGQHPLGDYAA